MALDYESKKRLTSNEMKIFIRTAGYTLFDHTRDEEILEGLKVEPVDLKRRRYKSNLLRHVTRTNSSTMTKILMNCRPNRRRRLGRTLQRILDETATGLSRHNWWRMIMMMIIIMMTNFTLSYLSFSIAQVHILKLSSPSKFRVKYIKKDTPWIAWPLITRRTGYRKTSVTNYQSILHHIQGDGIFQFSRY